MPIYSIGERRVQLLGDHHYIAHDAVLVGDIVLEDCVNIWFGVSIRADNDSVLIGARTNIQEGSVLHVDPDFPMRLGRNVTVGHKVMLHGCTIGDESLIGIGAVVLNGARIGKNCLVGAGALVTEDKEFPDGSMILGSPAKVVRMLTPERIEALRKGPRFYVDNARRFKAGLRRIA